MSEFYSVSTDLAQPRYRVRKKRIFLVAIWSENSSGDAPDHGLNTYVLHAVLPGAGERQKGNYFGRFVLRFSPIYSSF